MTARTWMFTLAIGCGLVAGAGCAIDDLDDAPPADAGAGGEPDADPGSGSEARCDREVSTSTVCLEAAAGQPGETVEVEVHVLLDEALCGEFHEAFATVEYDHEVLALASDEVDGDCFKLDEYEFSDGARVVDWYIQSNFDGESECPEPFAAGSQGTIAFTILPDAPEGDYPLPIETATVGGVDPECDGFASVGGVIDVLAP